MATTDAVNKCWTTSGQIVEILLLTLKMVDLLSTVDRWNDFLDSTSFGRKLTNRNDANTATKIMRIYRPANNLSLALRAYVRIGNSLVTTHSPQATASDNQGRLLESMRTRRPAVGHSYYAMQRSTGRLFRVGLHITATVICTVVWNSISFNCQLL